MKTILITGASSGIGRACAEKFFSHGFRVIICARNIAELEKIRNSFIQKEATEVLLYQVDVRENESVESMFNDLEKKGIKIDVLVNCAGLALDLTEIENGRPEDWDTMIDTNIKGLLYVTRRGIKQMSSGHIVNLGSIAGTYAYPKGSVYAATKSAVKFISDGLRKELVDREIKVTNIQPGLVETNFSNIRFFGDKEKAKSVYNGIEPLTGEDIADIIHYVVTAPKHVQICEITVTPLHQAAVNTVYRVEKGN